jgi:hypothetical protein
LEQDYHQVISTMQGHHLILGELVDFLSGQTIQDTHDERYRQKLARLLVDTKGYLKKEVRPRRELLVAAGEKKAIVTVDFEICMDGKTAMIIKYGPGSLVTRRRPALAASRLVAPYQVPVVVVTNGEDAEILEGVSGELISQGIEKIPAKFELTETISETDFVQITAGQAEVESRIVYAYEIDGSCPCDDTICRL